MSFAAACGAGDEGARPPGSAAATGSGECTSPAEPTTRSEPKPGGSPGGAGGGESGSPGGPGAPDECVGSGGATGKTEAGGSIAPTVAAVPTGGGLDLRRSGDVAFYQMFNVDSATRTVHYRDLDEGTRASTAVVVARVVDVATRPFEVADERLPRIGVVLQPTDVVAGSLPRQAAERLTVEFVGRGYDEEEVAKLKRRLPAQPGLWFLRFDDERPRDAFFHVISPQGLFVQGTQGVETPLTKEGDGDLGAQGRTYRRLSALVQRVRGVR
ncbi:hypothetical protein AB0J82_25910 [Asanoa sp. NPDC049518]|uniref:hypothetical protein n=1 Tax=unclassified Asanoa TaxID=2685164 RepID=UPI00343F1560